MDNSQEPENNNALIGISKHLKVIAEQQKRQNDYLKNISAVLTFLTVAVVLILLELYFGWQPAG